MKELNPKILMLVGPPGSGKGTQTELLAERFGYDIIHVSQIIRNKFENDAENPEVIAAKDAYESGRLVDGKVIAKWVTTKIGELGKEAVTSGLILDGAGRTIQEASATIDLLDDFVAKDKIRVFFVKISPEETLERNTKRIVCTKCLKPIDPKLVGEINICPHCEGKLGKREMDQKSVIENRLKVYEELSLPAVEYMRNEGLVIDVNGEQPIEDVYNDIANHITVK